MAGRLNMKIFRDMGEGQMVHRGLAIGYIRQWVGAFPLEHYASIRFRIYKWELVTLVAIPTRVWKNTTAVPEAIPKFRWWYHVWDITKDNLKGSQ